MSQAILMNDFGAEPPELKQAMVAAARRVLESGWYILGKEVTEFERLWSQLCRVRCSVAVGNGMDAIEIALRSVGVGPGDEVITTPMTAFATVLAILRAGAVPVLADIDEETALLSLESARRCLTKKTKAVVLVHLYGQVRDMHKWVEFCEQSGIVLVEDCAQSHLATWRGIVAGAFGAAGAYSFYPTKNLGAPGDAGALITSSKEVADLAARLRNYGQSVRYHHPELGMNSRMDEIHAAILAVRLKWLSAFTDRRRQIATSYNEGIRNPAVRLLAQPQEPSSAVYHLYVVTSDERDSLQEFLQSRHIQTLVHYPVPIHQQPPCSGLRQDPSGLKSSEAHAAKCLSLPCHPQMSDEDVGRVISMVNDFRAS